MFSSLPVVSSEFDMTVTEQCQGEKLKRPHDRTSFYYLALKLFGYSKNSMARQNTPGLHILVCFTSVLNTNGNSNSDCR